jgi:ubiquinone/menaquinone biosynthesis C-methylase UbiE
MRIGGRARIIARVNTDIRPTTPAARATVWARTFARLYDSSLWAGERAGAAALRAELLSQARGRTVEIGGGTGLNLHSYPAAVTELFVTEPDGSMRSRLARRLRRSERAAQIVDAPAEDLPFADQSVDTVVSTFVLCTVDDPERALREITRVLAPGGQLLFLEHVRSRSPRLAAWQDRLAGPWQKFARGCRCNRATAELIAQSGLARREFQERKWRAMPPIVRPLIVGRAEIGANHE